MQYDPTELLYQGTRVIVRLTYNDRVRAALRTSQRLMYDERKTQPRINEDIENTYIELYCKNVKKVILNADDDQLRLDAAADYKMFTSRLLNCSEAQEPFRASTNSTEWMADIQSFVNHAEKFGTLDRRQLDYYVFNLMRIGALDKIRYNGKPRSWSTHSMIIIRSLLYRSENRQYLNENSHIEIEGTGGHALHASKTDTSETDELPPLPPLLQEAVDEQHGLLLMPAEAQQFQVRMLEIAQMTGKTRVAIVKELQAVVRFIK
jgi:hypothetical protein